MTIRLVISICVFAVGLQAQAWREGNGGDGVRIGTKIYLLDLVESGVEKQSQDVSTSFSHTFFDKELNQWAQNQMVSVPQDVLLSKIGEIHRRNPVLSYMLVIALQKLDWTWINTPIKNIEDQGKVQSGVVTVIDDPSLEQLALRVNQTVYVQSALWSELDARNQAALILHEALFSLVHPKRSPEGLSMSSPRVRKIVGFLFSKKIQTASLDELLKIEAPEFRFTSLVTKPLELFHYTPKKDEMLFNAHWFLRAQNATGEMTILNEVGLKNSEAKTVRHICEFSSETQSTLYVGIAADQLQVTLGSDAKDAYEDYYLTHEYSADKEMIAMPIQGNLSTEKCIQQINAAKAVLMSDFITNPVK